MAIHQLNGISYVTLDLFDQHQILHGAFMRHGGVSPMPWRSLNMATSVGDSRENVLENRNRIATIMNFPVRSFYDVWQVHSNRVITTDRPRSSKTPHIQADAIITNQPDVVLLMLFADCVPIFLFDLHRRVACVVHAGWQGTANGIVVAAIQKMMGAFQCRPESMIAGIGPAISEGKYEIGEELIGKFNQSIFDVKEVISRKNSSIFLDLKKANRLMIKQSGVHQIEDMEICTASHSEDWFSHRAEKNQTGRFAAIIAVN